MQRGRKIEVITWVFGAHNYAVSTKIDGQLMETVVCSPRQVTKVRNQACDLWAQAPDEVYAAGIPELPVYKESVRLRTDTPIGIFTLVKLKG